MLCTLFQNILYFSIGSHEKSVKNALAAHLCERLQCVNLCKFFANHIRVNSALCSVFIFNRYSTGARIIIHYQVPSFEIQADIFTSLERI